MKIIIFVSYTYPFVGSGLGQVALKQAETLAKLGNDVTLVSFNTPKGKQKFRRNGVLHLKQNGTNFLNKLKIPVPIFAFSPEVLRKIRAADIVHSHDMLYPYSLQSGILAKLYKKPFILTQHAGFIKYPTWWINLLQSIVNKTLGKLVLILADKIILINEEVGSWIGVRGPRVKTLLNGVDLKLFHPATISQKRTLRKKYKLPQKKNILLHVGRLVEKKGFDKVYKARTSEYFTVVVGGGDLPEYIKEKDKDKDIVFMGDMPQDKLSEIYRLSDAFVLPSDCEGFPLSIQEAMASGLPIITTKHPGFEKYLNQNFVKFIKPNPSDIRSAAKKIFNNKKIREEMITYSLNHAKENSWENNGRELIKIYRGLTA